MVDRNQNEPKPNAKSAPHADRSTEPEEPRDDLQKNPDPDSVSNSASRPRGHTEEPDRTL